jgi:hypothetical protein
VADLARQDGHVDTVARRGQIQRSGDGLQPSEAPDSKERRAPLVEHYIAVQVEELLLPSAFRDDMREAV